MTPPLWVDAGLLAGAAALLLTATRPRPARRIQERPRSVRADAARRRALLAGAAGVAPPVWLGERLGVLALVAGVLTATVVWELVGRSEAPGARRERQQVRRELPHLVALLAATLHAGASPTAGLGLVVEALPGPAANRLVGARARLGLGEDPVVVWRSLAADPLLAPLGRALARAHDSGASVAQTVQRLGEDLAREQRASAEDRARAVGVRAALPLGLCLLPAFILLGIVPIVGGLVTALVQSP